MFDKNCTFRQKLHIYRPDVLAQAGGASLGWFLPILLVVSQPLLPLRLAHPKVGLVRHLLHPGSLVHFHFHSCLVHNALLEALAAQGALSSFPGGFRTAAVAPRSLGHHLCFVAGDYPAQVWHRAVGDLDGFAV